MAESSAVSAKREVVELPVSSSLREREVFRLLEPWRRRSSRIFQPMSLDGSVGQVVALGCDDTALSAFAQLGAFRLKAQRCMIIMFGKAHEYVLAESTQTLSLQCDAVHGSDDGLWIGTASYSSEEGLSKFVLPYWPAKTVPRPRLDPDHYHTQGCAASHFIMSDIREQASFKSFFPPFNSFVRFICAVPLRSYRDSLVGAYLIIDDVPRYGISEVELNFLEDMSRTVVNHLHATRAASLKKSAERLIKGLGVFTQGGDSLRNWWYEEWDAEQQRSRKQTRNLNTRDDSRERLANEDLGDAVVSRKPDTTPEVPRHDPGRDSKQHDNTNVLDFADSGPGPSTAKGDASESIPSPPTHFDLKSATAEIFARASNLIREAMSVDGVLFLDAGFTHSTPAAGLDPRRASFSGEFASHTSLSSTENVSERSSTSGSLEESVTRSSQEKGRRRRPRGNHSALKCAPLGFCTRTKSSLHQHDFPEIFKSFSQSRMQKLLARYPDGKVFNFSDEGALETSSSHEEGTPSEESSSVRPSVSSDAPFEARDAVVIHRLCSGARSVAFLPLWDAHREKWRSGAFVWTTTPGKYLSRDEDLAYLLAFADSIAGGMTRLDMMASDQAKSTFISTISHELRSPLHGVLAGSEFLLSSDLTGTQREMALTVKIAAGNLLDTINTILDFSKINALNGTRQASVSGEAKANGLLLQRADGGSSDGEEQNTDLAVLTENVVNTVVAGNRHRADSKTAMHRGSPKLPEREPVQVVLDIVARPSWQCEIDSGIWTRIITNLVGNSLKYTLDGYVHVKLNFTTEHVTLAIQDTGSGISAEFQKHHLYTPFKQEDPHAQGTGLGLFIVKQLVTQLGGDLVIESNSEDERGTKILVSIPSASAGFREHSSETTDSSFTHSKDAKIVLLTRSPVWTSSQRDRVRSTRTGMLKSSLKRSCQQWLQASFQNIAHIEEADSADVCLVLESEFLDWWKTSGREYEKKHKLPYMAVLAERFGRDLDDLSLDDLSTFCVFVDPPFGPMKLSRVIEQILQVNRDTNGGHSTPIIAHMKRERRSPVIHADAKTNGATPTPKPGPTGTGKRLLLVEDNELNMRLLVAWSRRLGLDYVQANDGLEAVQAYTADPASFDLVVMDISMPVMDGFTATSEIRSYESRHRLKRCRIIALTGVASADARANAVKAGIDDFLVKPASLASIRELIA